MKTLSIADCGLRIAEWGTAALLLLVVVLPVGAIPPPVDNIAKFPGRVQAHTLRNTNGASAAGLPMVTVNTDGDLIPTNTVNVATQNVTGTFYATNVAGILTNAVYNSPLAKAMLYASGRNAWELPSLNWGTAVRATNAANSALVTVYTLATAQTNYTAIGGKPVLQGGGGGVTIKDWSLADNSGDTQTGGSIRFYTDAPLIEVRTVGANTNYSWNVVVDGQVAKRNLAPYTGTYGYLVIDFAGVSQERCIEFQHQNGAEGFDQVAVATNYTIWKPGARPSMLVLGDSVSSGAVTTYLFDSYYVRLGHLLGLDRYMCAFGGTGYTNNNGSDGTTTNYLARVNNKLAGNGQSYDLILCWSSSNDSGGGDTNNLPVVMAAASNTWVRLRQLYPTAKIVVTGYTPLRIDAWRDAAELACSNSFALWNDGNSLFIPTRSWMTVGSRDLYRYDDDHPNDAGHLFYAQRLAAEIRGDVIRGSVRYQPRAPVYPDTNNWVGLGAGQAVPPAPVAPLDITGVPGSQAEPLLFHVGTNTSGFNVQSNGWTGAGTKKPLAPFHATNSDGAANFLFSGTTRAVRYGFSSGGTQIQGIDVTGVNSFQPLFVGGSILYGEISGVAKTALIANGNYGVNTNTPQAKFQVASDIVSAQPVVQFGTVVRPSLMNLDTNGVLSFDSMTAAGVGIRSTNGHLKVTDGTGNLSSATNMLQFPGTNNWAAGTNTVAHQQAGKIRLANGQSLYYVTNNLVTTNSIILGTLNSFDDTGRLAYVVPSAGLITIGLNAGSSLSAGTEVSWFIVSP